MENIINRLIMNGIVLKGARILCLSAPPEVPHLLAKSGCSATVAAIESGLLQRPPGSLAYDLVFVSLGIDSDADVPIQADRLREALFYLRPGGFVIALGNNGSDAWKERIDTLAARLGALQHHNKSVEFVREFSGQDQRPLLMITKKPAIYVPQRKVTWIATNQELDQACNRLRCEPVVGLDVETTLWEPRILCTVQLAIETEIFIVDALALRDLTPIKDVMGNESILKIIHNSSFEEKVLASCGITIRNIFDTLHASRKKWKKGVDGGHKLGHVCERELRVYLDKSMQASDWTRRPLTQKQIEYAAADAEVLLALYRIFAGPPKTETMELF